MLLLSHQVRRASAADVNSSNSPDQVRAGLPEWQAKSWWDVVSGSIIPTFIYRRQGKAQKSELKTGTSVNSGFDGRKSQSKLFFSLFRKYFCFFFFLTDIDSALPHEICCCRGNNLQLGFSFYSVISSRNHFVLTVTNAPEFGRPERVSYIYTSFHYFWQKNSSSLSLIVFGNARVFWR